MRHTVAALSNMDGEILATVRVNNEPISLHTLPPLVLKTRLGRLFRDLLIRAEMKTSQLRESSVCIGLTGVTFKYDREIVLPDMIRETGLNIGRLICTGDVEIVFASHARRSHGSAILCHSGSTAYAVTGIEGTTQHFRFGGWGPVLGDEGSGFAMGRSALREIGNEHDYRIEEVSQLWTSVNTWLQSPFPPSPLWQAGSSRWKMTLLRLQEVSDSVSSKIDPRELIFYFSHNMQQHGLAVDPEDSDGIEGWRRIVSGLVMPLLEAYRKGDKAAERIVNKAIAQLVRQYNAACSMVPVTKIERFNENPVVLYGGVITHNSDFCELLMAGLRKVRGNHLEFIRYNSPGVMRPVCGALLFALGGSHTGCLQLPSPAIIQKVMTYQSFPRFSADLIND